MSKIFTKSRILKIFLKKCKNEKTQKVSWKFYFIIIENTQVSFSYFFLVNRDGKFCENENSKSVMKIFYFINHRTIQKDLPLGKFLDDSIELAILERKFLLSLRIIKFSQWRPRKAEDTSRYYYIFSLLFELTERSNFLTRTCKFCILMIPDN
jgi:hypothetical protein